MFWNLIQVPYERYKLHHLALFCLLLIYSFVGAVIFCALEAEHEDNVLNADNRNNFLQSVKAKKELVEKIQELYFNGRDDRDGFYETQLRKAIGIYDTAMNVKPIINHKRQWNIWGGLYYAGTIYTTIGYGDLAATTTGGRIFTIFYAIIGIPMFITILNDWGTIMFRLSAKIWKMKILAFIIRSVSNMLKEKKDQELTTEEEPFCVETKPSIDQETKEEETVSLYLVVVVLFFWFFLCVLIFCYFENWTTFEAAYFFFISLTTIGFGDLTLSHKVAVYNFLLIIIGLSVVSMAINVVQKQLEILFTRIISNIDKEFKNTIGQDDTQSKTVTTEDNMEQQSSKLKRAAKKEDAAAKFSSSMDGSSKFLMKFMGNHQRKLLNEKYEERSRMRNKGTQMNRTIKVTSVQTNERQHEEFVEEEEEEPVTKGGIGIRTRRLYIYNCGE